MFKVRFILKIIVINNLLLPLDSIPFKLIQNKYNYYWILAFAEIKLLNFQEEFKW